MKMCKLTMFVAFLFSALILQACCRPSEEDQSKRTKRQAVEDRQIIGGLSTLGALIQPILFMIGMANFMGRIPTFFNRVRDRFSSTLAGTGAPAGAGRRKRDVDFTYSAASEEELNRALDMLHEADHKYNNES